MNKISVAILGTRGVPNQYGGFEQCAQYLSAGLIERGYNVTVYNPHWHPYADEEYKGVKIRKKWCPEALLGSSSHFIYDYLCLRDAIKRETDIVFELGYANPAPSYLLCRFNRSVIITNMDGLEWQRDKWSGPVKKLIRWCEAVAARKSHHMVADNPGIQNYLRSTYGKEATYIPYGAKVSVGHRSEHLAKYGLEPGRYYLAIARLEPENNLEMILRGYSSASVEEPFLLVGNVKNAYGEHLKNMFRDSNVRFLGGIYDPEVLNALRHFAKLYFHGHSVGGTNPALLEAMAAGACIRAHDNEFNRSVVENGALYFKAEDDVTEIIRKANEEKKRDAERSDINLKKIEMHYSWDSVVNSYADLIEKYLYEDHDYGLAE